MTRAMIRRYKFRRWWVNSRQTLRARWNNAMPKFFKWVFGVFAFIGGLALAINTGMVAAGAQPHAWWVDIYPYIIGTSAGAAFICKFTAKDRSNIPGFEDEKKNTVLNHDNF